MPERPHDETPVSQTWMLRGIDRLIPAALHVDPESQLRSRVLVTSCFVISGLSLAAISVRIATTPFDRAIVVSLVALAITVTLPWVQRWTRSYRIAGGIVVAMSLVVLPSFHLLLGIFPAPALLLFPMLPLLHTFFVGGRSGFMIALLVSLIIVALRLKLPPPSPGELGTLSWTFAAIGAGGCLMVALVAHAYERARVRSQERLQAANIAFEQAHARAEAENRSKTEFLRHVSHELRTPLNAILGYGQLVEEELADAGDVQHAADIAKISDASKQLLALINDLLDISRIEAGAVDLEFEEVTPLRLLERVRDTILPLVAANRNTLVLVVAPDLPPLITDEQRLRQVLLNLLSNACKFTDNGEIVISADIIGDALLIRVRDSGVGMTPEQCARLFEPFAQVHASLALRRQGSGLGLALSRRLIEQLGGTIEVRSESGSGSEFSVRLP
ncbi:MAG: HAMP domain-containing histidine kinase, partial [Nannocystis sp.]